MLKWVCVKKDLERSKLLVLSMLCLDSKLQSPVWEIKQKRSVFTHTLKKLIDFYQPQNTKQSLNVLKPHFMEHTGDK